MASKYIKLGILLVCAYLSLCVKVVLASDVIMFLKNHNFKALESHYSNIQGKFEQGLIDEFALLDAYKPFYLRKDVLSNELSLWVIAYPKSYYAHLAKGTYYRKLGEYHRGTDYFNNVPNSAITYMENAFNKSEKELKKAIWFSDNPYLAILNLLNIARYRGDNKAASLYLEMGNRYLNDNILIRARYLDHLKPRWGGTYDQMEDFLSRCEKEAVNSEVIGLLSSFISNDKGISARERGRNREAANHFKQALIKAKRSSSGLKLKYISSSVMACRNGLVSGIECP